MCQLLGMNCNNTASINFSFTGFAERGGRTSDHVDGWGIGFYERSGCRVFHDDQPSCVSPLAKFIREYPIKSGTVIGHIRKATQGEVRLANCHPFQREWMGQTWLFANNGDLRDFSPELNGQYLPVGDTDSELAFCWLMQRLRAHFSSRRHPPTWRELAPQISAITSDIARHGNFNYLLSNGDAVFAHCSSRLWLLNRSNPFPKVRLVDCDVTVDLGALNHADDRMAVVATEPLTEEETWTPFQTGECKVLVDGQEVWSHINPRTQRFPMPTHRSGRVWSPPKAVDVVEL